MGQVATQAGAALALFAVALTGCGSVPGGGEGPLSSPSSSALVIEVEVSSDTSTASRLQVGINTRESPARIDEENVPLPFGERFEVSTSKPFPLNGVSVGATAAPGAGWIKCRLLLDGEVVSEDRGEGPVATATCSKKLRLGPQ